MLIWPRLILYHHQMRYSFVTMWKRYGIEIFAFCKILSLYFRSIAKTDLNQIETKVPIRKPNRL